MFGRAGPTQRGERMGSLPDTELSASDRCIYMYICESVSVFLVVHVHVLDSRPANTT